MFSNYPFVLLILISFSRVTTNDLLTHRLADEIVRLLHYTNQKGCLITGEEKFWNDELLVSVRNSIPYPFALFDNQQFLLSDFELLKLNCHSAVVFADCKTPVVQLYYQIRKFALINDVILISIDDIDEIGIFKETANEKFILAVNRGRYLDIFVKSFNVVRRYVSVKELEKQFRTKRIGGHLAVATLNYPPITIVELDADGNATTVKGIEPAIVELLAESLHFTYNFTFASRSEMWGAVVGSGSNVTCTGLLGILHRNEAEIATGDLYVDFTRLPCSDYSLSFKMNYECFLVPASRPYPKWTALYHPLTWPVWLVTVLSFFLAVATLRCIARFTNVDAFFSEIGRCCLFTLGNLLGVQQAEEVRATANRLFFITWLIAATIIPTGYRSGLISYMTLPFTPSPINTMEQLLASSIKKTIFGEFIIKKLASSPNAVNQKLATQLIANYDLDYMYSLLGTGQWALDSSEDNLKYIAATRFPPSSQYGPRVHLMKEYLLPMWAAFGLRKNSQVKQLIDDKLMLLVEAGLVDFHRSQYAKKLPDWNPKANDNNELVAFSLDTLQGAFYLYAFGIAIALCCFVCELLCVRCCKKK